MCIHTCSTTAGRPGTLNTIKLHKYIIHIVYDMCIYIYMYRERERDFLCANMISYTTLIVLGPSGSAGRLQRPQGAMRHD